MLEDIVCGYRGSEKRPGIGCSFYAHPGVGKGDFEATALCVGVIEMVEQEEGGGEGCGERGDGGGCG